MRVFFAALIVLASLAPAGTAEACPRRQNATYAAVRVRVRLATPRRPVRRVLGAAGATVRARVKPACQGNQCAVR